MCCSVEVLQDWHAMVEALTDDQANEARGDRATTNLIMLLAATVHTATGGAQAGTRTDARWVPALLHCPMPMQCHGCCVFKHCFRSLEYLQQDMWGRMHDYCKCQRNPGTRVKMIQ